MLAEDSKPGIMENINVNNTLFDFEVNQSPEDLHFYTQTKLNIADQLRIVHEGLKRVFL
ncbi:MAG: hypothetical protein ACTHK8_16975 [Ginsengibacter sp.]